MGDEVTVAALFVERGGVYWDLPGVDPWDEARDARLYAGPHPVVAHPPCDRWCQMAPVNQARYGHKVGEDEGKFSFALEAVSRYGGVLEHPAYSIAWREFCLLRPDPHGGWTMEQRAANVCTWVCEVSQRHFGHRATKRTWLYACLPRGVYPPSVPEGKGPPPEAWISADRPRAELAARGIAQLSKKEAKRTPPAFRDLLLSIARSNGTDGLPRSPQAEAPGEAKDSESPSRGRDGKGSHGAQRG